MGENARYRELGYISEKGLDATLRKISHVLCEGSKEEYYSMAVSVRANCRKVFNWHGSEQVIRYDIHDVSACMLDWLQERHN